MSENGVEFEEGQEVDMGSVEEGSFEVLPRGVYNCIIDEAEYGISQSSGKPMWTLTLQVEDGDYAGRKLFSHMSFSEKALPMTKRFLNRIAPELAGTKFNPASEDVLNVLRGKRCKAKVKIKVYEGEQRNNVGDIMPAGEAAFVG